MATVLHLRKDLVGPPVALVVPGVGVRAFQLPNDVGSWLQLRERAMADQLPRARTWSEAEFLAEMANKAWWRSDRTWLAIAGELRLAGAESNATADGNPATRRSPAIPSIGAPMAIGTVTLAMREGQAASVPVVHWLLVDPAWRRRGIGSMLLSHLERAAWDAGHREVQLETHANWQPAVAFYQSMGYAPLDERSPR